jgi:hypothetical protein
MAIRALSAKASPPIRKTTRAKSAAQKTLSPPDCARDRLLNALAATPRLNAQAATRIQKAVQEAREASLGDELPA